MLGKIKKKRKGFTFELRGDLGCRFEPVLQRKKEEASDLCKECETQIKIQKLVLIFCGNETKQREHAAIVPRRQWRSKTIGLIRWEMR